MTDSTLLMARIQQRCLMEEHRFLDLSSQFDPVESEASQLLDLSKAIAGYFRAHCADHCVLICLDSCGTLIPVFWGAVAAGLTAIPVTLAASDGNPSRQDLQDFQQFIDMAGPLAIVIDEASAWLVSKLKTNGLAKFLPLSRILSSLSAGSDRFIADQARIVFALQTSGTTGRCKYAAFSGQWFDYEVSNARSVLSLFPLASSTGIGFAYVLNRLSAYLPLRDAVRDPDRLLAAVEKYRIQVIVIPPVMVQVLLAHFDEPKRALVRRDLSSLIKVNIGSSTIPLSAVEQLDARLRQWGAAEGIIHFAYGLTETGGVAYGPFKGSSAHREQVGLRIGPVSPGVEVEIREEPSTTHGLIAVRRQFSFLGYLKERKNHQWLLDPFQSGTDWFETGDLGCQDSADLVLIGRLKDTIVSNSRKLSLAAIESYVQEVLADALSCVVACAGPSEELWLFLVLAQEASGLSVAQLDAVIAPKLRSQFGISLGSVRILSFDDLPRTSTGKIHKQRLLESFFVDSLPPSDGAKVLGSADRSSLLDQLFDEIRKHAAVFKARDPKQPLAAFGIDSLALMQVIGSLEHSTGLYCWVEGCPPDPTVAELASLFQPAPVVAGGGAQDQITSDDFAALMSDLKHYPSRAALAHQICVANLQVNGERMGVDQVVQRFNANAAGVPFVIVGNIDAQSLRYCAKDLSGHPIYFARLLEDYSTPVNHSYLVCCYLDWLEAVLPRCQPVLVGHCGAGILALDLARHLSVRGRAPRLLTLMDWPVGRESHGDPYMGLAAYHVHYSRHRGLAARKNEIEKNLLRQTPNKLMTYWSGDRSQPAGEYLHMGATLEALSNIMRHEYVGNILRLSPSSDAA